MNGSNPGIPGGGHPGDPCGWIVVQFIATHDGPWLFHCHTDWHMVMGMGLVFIVGDWTKGASLPTNRTTPLSATELTSYQVDFQFSSTHPLIWPSDYPFCGSVYPIQELSVAQHQWNIWEIMTFVMIGSIVLLVVGGIFIIWKASYRWRAAIRLWVYPTSNSSDIRTLHEDIDEENEK